jgi:hypothetical protein
MCDLGYKCRKLHEVEMLIEILVIFCTTIKAQLRVRTPAPHTRASVGGLFDSSKSCIKVTPGLSYSPGKDAIFDTSNCPDLSLRQIGAPVRMSSRY